MIKRNWKVLGLMSGTSLDGLDIALCEFVATNGDLESFQILKAETIVYSEEEKEKLNVMEANAVTFAEADAWFGRFCGEKVASFLDNHRLQADLVASHGHTIFHQPQRKFTSQIGNGAAIAAACHLPVVSDFRTMDVAMGGQGAPLVPIGDLLLFPQHVFCLNVGGIANLTIKKESKVVAYDVCPANIALNAVVKELNMAYDQEGGVARSGNVNQELLLQLQALDYYQSSFPKSLGKEWIDSVFWPLISFSRISPADKSATICEHIALQIAHAVKLAMHKGPSRMLVTGGGAFHSFLMEKLQDKLSGYCKVELPNPEMIAFKEALVFAFLGWRRMLNLPNALRTVTGAEQDSIGGALYGDFSRIRV